MTSSCCCYGVVPKPRVLAQHNLLTEIVVHWGIGGKSLKIIKQTLLVGFLFFCSLRSEAFDGIRQLVLCGSVLMGVFLHFHWRFLSVEQLSMFLCFLPVTLRCNFWNANFSTCGAVKSDNFCYFLSFCKFVQLCRFPLVMRKWKGSCRLSDPSDNLWTVLWFFQTFLVFGARSRYLSFRFMIRGVVWLVSLFYFWTDTSEKGSGRCSNLEKMLEVRKVSFLSFLEQKLSWHRRVRPSGYNAFLWMLYLKEWSFIWFLCFSVEKHLCSPYRWPSS